jgi:hypothetical protein
VATIGFVVTIGQAIHQYDGGRHDSDSIVGTLGAYANWATAMLILMAACVALGRFLTARGRAWPWLALAAILPLFTAWAVVMIVAVLLPIAGLAVLVGGALLRSRPPAWRFAAGAVAVVAATAAIFGSYHQWHPDSYQLLTHGDLGGAYLKNATIIKTAPRPGAGAGTAPSGRSEIPTAAVPVPVPGRFTQYKNSFSIIDNEPTTLVFGKGLGAATYAENVGVDRAKGDPQIAQNSFTDFSTLLIERGLLGMLVVAACVLALAVVTLRSLRSRSPDDRWSTAVLVGYPGVLAVMGAAAVYASPFRNSGTSGAFFLITALVIGAAVGRRQTA